MMTEVAGEFPPRGTAICVRVHGPAAYPLADRAATLAGCAGSS
jgi:hypothetical protein